MSFEVYSGEVYNRECKNEFLQRYPERTRNAYTRIFYNSLPSESKYNTDLLEFNIEQISNVMRSMNPSTRASSRASVSIIRAYIDWAISLSYRSNNINPLDAVPSDWDKQFIDDTELPYYSKCQIDDVIEHCNNDQDSVIISLLFEGAGGKEVSELRNLKPEHIDEVTSTLTLFNSENKERRMKVSEQCINLVISASKQPEYLKGNGEMQVVWGNLKSSSELITNGYVIKPSKTRNAHFEQVNPHLIYARLANLAEYFGMENLKKVKNIQRSGMIWLAKQLLEQYGTLEKEQYLMICKQFDVGQRINEISGEKEYSWSLLKESINPEMITKIYGTKTAYQKR